MGFFIFNLITINFIVIDTAFRKSSVENLLVKVVALGTSKNW